MRDAETLRLRIPSSLHPGNILSYAKCSADAKYGASPPLLSQVLDEEMLTYIQMANDFLSLSPHKSYSRGELENGMREEDPGDPVCTYAEKRRHLQDKAVARREKAWFNFTESQTKDAAAAEVKSLLWEAAAIDAALNAVDEYIHLAFENDPLLPRHRKLDHAGERECQQASALAEKFRARFRRNMERLCGRIAEHAGEAEKELEPLRTQAYSILQKLQRLFCLPADEQELLRTKEECNHQMDCLAECEAQFEEIHRRVLAIIPHVSAAATQGGQRMGKIYYGPFNQLTVLDQATAEPRRIRRPKAPTGAQRLRRFLTLFRMRLF